MPTFEWSAHDGKHVPTSVRLGGSPSVLAVSMCFFRGSLLLGYAYAFALNRRLAARGAVLLHLGLLAAACLALPIALPRNAVALFGDGSYLALSPCWRWRRAPYTQRRSRNS